MKLYELILEDDTDGVFALSFVENPAIEMDFVYFGEEYKFQSVSDDKRLVVGPILVPNKKIMRVDGAGEAYEVYLSEETVAKIAHNFMKNGYQNEATLEHNKKVDGISLVESWVVESREKDKSKLYNMTLPKGTWAGIFRIDNDEMWKDYIKNGKVKGISIEGLFQHLRKDEGEGMQTGVMMNLWDKPINELSEVEAEIVLSKIKEVLFEQPTIDSTYGGETPESGSYVSPETFVEAPNLDVLGYETSYFQICPMAQQTFGDLLKVQLDDDTIGMVRSAAVIADRIFEIEADVLEEKQATPIDEKIATVLIKDFYDIMREISEEVSMRFDVSYMDGHLETIKSYL